MANGLRSWLDERPVAGHQHRDGTRYSDDEMKELEKQRRFRESVSSIMEGYHDAIRNTDHARLLEISKPTFSK